MSEIILNYINNEWVKPTVSEYADVLNPATGEVIAETPLCGGAEVEAAAQAAAAAFHPGARPRPRTGFSIFSSCVIC